MKTKLKYILVIGLYRGLLFGHDIPVHQTITLYAQQSAYNNSFSYHNFLNVVSSDVALPAVTNSMINGSGFEDHLGLAPGTLQPEVRPINHFYDPLDNTYGKGLSDSIRPTFFGYYLNGDARSLVGTNSFAWASVSNCIGISHSYYPQPINTWSWQNARNYEWLGLTATNQADRQANLLNMFRSVGQVVHLLQDTSQPQHVRNEQHLAKSAWESPIEAWGLKNVSSLNYGDGSMLDWSGAGFVKLEDFWDRHLYAPGDETVLDNAEAPGGAQLGLAEWCNANFIGDRHQYAEYYDPGDIRYYPFPSLEESTDFESKRQHWHTGARLTSLENGLQVERLYLDKKGAGVQFNNHSTMTYFGAYFSTHFFGKGVEVVSTSIRDNQVLSSYHNVFIPKAVKYSAGLIDYFFRGAMNASIVNVDTNAPTFTVSFLNTSKQDFSKGAFYILQDSNGVRTLIGQTNLTDLLPPNGIMGANDNVTATFSGLLPTNQLIIVYQGTIGISNGAPLDPVDAGIAIAVSGPIPFSVTANPLWTDSGIAVTSGQTLTISSFGTWSGGQGPVTGDGVDDGDDFDLFLGGVNHNSLIAYVGTHPPYEDSTGANRWGDSSYFPQSIGAGYWLVGTGTQFATDRSGELWFLINDDAETEDTLDNSGSLTVTVSIKGNQ